MGLHADRTSRLHLALPRRRRWRRALRKTRVWPASHLPPEAAFRGARTIPSALLLLPEWHRRRERTLVHGLSRAFRREPSLLCNCRDPPEDAPRELVLRSTACPKQQASWRSPRQLPPAHGGAQSLARAP